MPRLSLAMIVKNEEARLGACLASVKGLVDEMVVVDTGSTDGTVALAESFGAKVGRFPWCGDFSAARHASLELCTGDWVLLVDADEAVDALDHPVIRKALEDETVHAYRLLHRNYFRSGAFIGTHGPARRNDAPYAEGRAFSHFSDTRATRLFRNHLGLRFEGRVHALPDPWFEARGLRIADLDAVIHHYGKLDEAREQEKVRSYLDMAKRDAAEHPDNPQFHYDVAQQALLAEDWEAALAAAEAYLRLKDKAPMMVFLAGGTALQRLGRWEEALRWFDALLAGQPGHAVALCAKAESLGRLGRAEEAQGLLLKAIEAEPGFSLPFLKLAELLEAGGAPASARKVLEAGLDQNPKDLRLWEALVGQSARLRSPSVAQDAWDALRAVPDGGQGIWHLLVAHALLAQGGRDEARAVVAQGLEAFPGDRELMALGEKLRD